MKNNTTWMVHVYLLILFSLSSMTSVGWADPSYPIRDTYFTKGLDHALKSADLNEDGIFDLVTVNSEDSTLSVLFGEEDGSFDPENIYYEVGTWPANVSIADLDGDGHKDLVNSSSPKGRT